MPTIDGPIRRRSHRHLRTRPAQRSRRGTGHCHQAGGLHLYRHAAFLPARAILFVSRDGASVVQVSPRQVRDAAVSMVWVNTDGCRVGCHFVCRRKVSGRRPPHPAPRAHQNEMANGDVFLQHAAPPQAMKLRQPNAITSSATQPPRVRHPGMEKGQPPIAVRDFIDWMLAASHLFRATIFALYSVTTFSITLPKKQITQCSGTSCWL